MQGERLRQLRTSKKISQPKLAEMLDVDISTIGKWEIHNATPNAKTLVELADYFNVSVDYLLGRVNEILTPLSNEEIILVQNYRKCNEENKNRLLNVSENIAEK